MLCNLAGSNYNIIIVTSTESMERQFIRQYGVCEALLLGQPMRPMKSGPISEVAVLPKTSLMWS